MKKISSKKGITLIALIITIIIMLILAGVSLNAILGDNGIITKAQEAKISYEDSAWYETAEQILAVAFMDKDKTENMPEYLKEKFLEYYSNDEVIVSKLGDGYIILVGDRTITVDSNFKITSSKDTTYLISKNDEWEFEVVNGTARLTRYLKDSTGTIQIPYAVVDRNDASENPEVYIVTALGEGLFNWYTDLIKIDFSQVDTTLTTIGARCFEECTNLEINLPNDLPTALTKIGDKAFYNCKKLTGNINTIINSGISFGKGVFMKCPNLTGNIQDVFDQNFYIDSDGNPSSTSITEGQFSGYTGLTGSLTIPYYITSIGANAFSNCSGITNLVFENTAENPSQCTAIGDYAFYKDSAIANSLVLPKDITSIGDYAFQYCSRNNRFNLTN
jgi:type II secretory pathway pseudopilin PulG